MTSDDVVREHFARVTALDPLFPVLEPPEGSERIEVPGAVGFHTTDLTSPGTALWAAARRHTLRVRLGGKGAPEPLGALLDAWETHLVDKCTRGDRDESAVVNWPSRDSDAVRELVFHGFATATVIAVRPAGRPIPHVTTSHTIRPAEPRDIEVLTDLAVSLHNHDARYGMVTERPNARELLAEEVKESVEAADGLTVVAERDGEVIGFVDAEVGERASWAQPMVAASPTAYLGKLFVRPGARSGGVATAMVAEVHAKLDAMGVPVTLMEHVLHNEFSTPFWYRQGYRPLWTIWQRRPAVR
ncbi:GNAT family N-acetyltransferase [Allokutzneria oryzae]|uniref:GNAT family N-acetyltransferase n=1 Tax=Allokutzneria oryzae TaxID=1378989 RepID=A0ABV5ZUI5_9PSEU